MQSENIKINNNAYKKAFITDVRPCYDYQDGNRTNDITAYKYKAVYPELGFDGFYVKIQGEQLMEKPKEGYIEAEFQNIELFIYCIDGRIQLSAKADGIHVTNKKA